MNGQIGHFSTLSWRLALASASFLAATGSAFCQGTISGIVTDQGGSPVPGATISYNNVPALASLSGGYVGPVVSSAVQADASGSYTAPGLPYGTYYVCATGTQPTQLRSCEWDLPMGVAQLSAASPSATLTLALGQGIPILMTLADPLGKVVDRLPYQIRGPAAGNLKVGVTKGTWYAPGELVSSVNGTRTYQAVVPPGGTYKPAVWTTLAITPDPSAAATITVGSSDVTYSLGAVQ